VSSAPRPAEHAWWLASRASGIVALLLVTASVLLGLGMATRMLRRRGITPMLAPVHEQLALAGLVAIAVHGITLLGDRWLHPGLAGIVVPFALPYRATYTGIGVLAGYLAALLGLSFYIRGRIGAKRWRVLHRLTSLVYVMAMVHTVGAGTDAGARWLRLTLILSGAPVLFLLLVRLLPERRASAKPAPAPRPPTPAQAARQPTRTSGPVAMPYTTRYTPGPGTATE
jgi:methionine sulfoxide reductase heme-binding subunit